MQPLPHHLRHQCECHNSPEDVFVAQSSPAPLTVTTLSPQCKLFTGGLSAEDQRLAVTTHSFEHEQEERRRKLKEERAGGGDNGRYQSGIEMADEIGAAGMKRMSAKLQQYLWIFAIVEGVFFRQVGFIRNSSVRVLKFPFGSSRKMLAAPLSGMLYFSLCILFALWYLVRVTFVNQDVTLATSWAQIAMDVATVACGVSLIVCCCTDPGYLLPGSASPGNTMSGVTDGSEPMYHPPTEVINGIEIRRVFCEVCRHFSPVRARHCHVCGLCVVGHDHHCAVIGCCVGARNMRAFTFFCGTAAIIALLSLISTVLFIYFEPMSLLVATAALLSFVCFVPMAVLVPIFFLSLFHGIIFNETAAERVAQRRSRFSRVPPHSTDGRQHHNPFDLGVVRNTASVCCAAPAASILSIAHFSQYVVDEIERTAEILDGS